MKIICNLLDATLKFLTLLATDFALALDVGFCDINYSNHTSDPVGEKGSRDSRRQGQGSGYCKLSSPNHHLQEGLIDNRRAKGNFISA